MSWSIVCCYITHSVLVPLLQLPLIFSQVWTAWIVPRENYYICFIGLSLANYPKFAFASNRKNIYTRARNNGQSTDNVRTDCGFDRSKIRLAGLVDRSKFSRTENEINLRFLLFSCYLSSRCVLQNFDMKSWWHATRVIVYNSCIKTDIGIRPLPVTKLPNISTFISNFQFFISGLWAPKRVIHHIHLTGQKRYVTEQKWIWPVIVTGDYLKIILSPVDKLFTSNRK